MTLNGELTGYTCGTVLGALAVGCGQMWKTNQLLVWIRAGRLMTVSCIHYWSAVRAMCHCWCYLYSSYRDFNKTGAYIRKLVVSHSRNWLVS